MFKILYFSSFTPVFNSRIILVFSLSEIPWNCHKHLTKNKHTKLKKTNLLETPKIWKKKKTNSPVFFNQCWIDFNIFWLQELKKPSFFFGLVSVQKVGFFNSGVYLDTQKCLISPQKLGLQRLGFFPEKNQASATAWERAGWGAKEESLTPISSQGFVIHILLIKKMKKSSIVRDTTAKNFVEEEKKRVPISKVC